MTVKIPGRHRAAGHREASAQITAELATIDFPVRKEQLMERVSDRSIEVSDGVAMPLGEMLKFVQRREFKSIAQVQDELDRRWQEFRAVSGAQEDPLPRMTEPGSAQNRADK